MLPNGYYLSCTSQYMYGIYKESFIPDDSTVYYEGVLASNITQYAVCDNYVVGCCETIPSKESTEELGYFVIDTKTHEISKGLSEDKFQALLKAKNIEQDVETTMLVDVKNL